MNNDEKRSRVRELLKEERRLRARRKALMAHATRYDDQIFALENERLGLERQLKAVQVLEPKRESSKGRSKAQPKDPATQIAELAKVLGRDQVLAMLGKL